MCGGAGRGDAALPAGAAQTQPRAGGGGALISPSMGMVVVVGALMVRAPNKQTGVMMGVNATPCVSDASQLECSCSPHMCPHAGC
jgi:hypothetical protein